jgi:hypothetical protein
MSNPNFIKTFTAAENMQPHQIVGISDENDYTAIVGTADNVIGVTTEVGANAGDRVDVILLGTAYVKLSAQVNASYMVGAAADNSGFGTSAPPQGMAIGVALQSGIAGDVIEIFLNVMKF